MNKKPVVAITGASIIYNGDIKSPLQVVREKYFKLIEDAGGIPVLIGNSSNKKLLQEYSEYFDCLLLTGGGDIHPKFYKKRKDTATGGHDMVIDEKRDKAELYLVKKFFDKKKPILGICRGAQVINVAFDGTLVQDINGKNKTSNKHLIEDEDGGWYIPAHSVSLNENTFLNKLSKLSHFKVNSVHHQCINKIGNGLVKSAVADDGITEAVELKNMSKQFVLGIQWHIEQMQSSSISKKIAKSFITASRN